MAVVTIGVNFLERYRPQIGGAALADGAAERAAIAFRAHANVASLGPRFLWTAPDNGLWYYQRVGFEIEDLHVTAAFPALQRRVFALADHCRADADRTRHVEAWVSLSWIKAAIAACLLALALGMYGLEAGGETPAIEQSRHGHHSVLTASKPSSRWVGFL
jgi:hypothetical protein